MLKGIALANPGTIRYVPEFNLIMRANAPNQNKVSIIQGSGSGHEPAHVMIVGAGMLDGACPGDVFSAPPMDYVVGTSKLLNSPQGILHIVNNYSGDRMAFEMASEMLEAEGIKVAVNTSTDTPKKYRVTFFDDDYNRDYTNHWTNETGDLKRMVRMGDWIKLEFIGTISEDELLHADGVINYGISRNLCEIIVDDGERRLGTLIAVLSRSGAQIKKVTLGQTELEDVFIEFAKGTDSDMGVWD